MVMEKMGGGSPEKEPQEEYHILNEKGDPVGVMQLPKGVGDEFYVEILSDSAEAILPYKKLLRGEVNHEKDTVKWSDGTEEKAKFEEDVVFVEPSESGEEMRIIPEKNVKIGKINRTNKTISFE